MPQTLTVRALAAGYAKKTVVRDAQFDVAERRTLAIVGPSGAGKSTLLRAIAGLGPVFGGDVTVGGRSLLPLPPQARRVAMVFSQDALVRHLTVRANLALVARDRDGLTSRIERLAQLLEIDAHLERRPGELSTGERARVAIARALLCEPDVLLLDEPLAALDPELRALVRDELLHVRERFAGPMVFVTHDHADAMTVGDELAVLIDGRIVDRGLPQRVFDAPATAPVATFLGVRPMNLLDGALFAQAPGVLVGIRPERMHFASDGALRGTALRVERTGADAYVRVAHAAGELLVRVDAGNTPAPGEAVAIGYDHQALRRFDRASGNALP